MTAGRKRAMSSGSRGTADRTPTPDAPQRALDGHLHRQAEVIPWNDRRNDFGLPTGDTGGSPSAGEGVKEIIGLRAARLAGQRLVDDVAELRSQDRHPLGPAGRDLLPQQPSLARRSWRQNTARDGPSDQVARAPPAQRVVDLAHLRYDAPTPGGRAPCPLACAEAHSLLRSRGRQGGGEAAR